MATIGGGGREDGGVAREGGSEEVAVSRPPQQWINSPQVGLKQTGVGTVGGAECGGVVVL